MPIVRLKKLFSMVGGENFCAFWLKSKNSAILQSGWSKVISVPSLLSSWHLSWLAFRYMGWSIFQYQPPQARASFQNTVPRTLLPSGRGGSLSIFAASSRNSAQVVGGFRGSRPASLKRSLL